MNNEDDLNELRKCNEKEFEGIRNKWIKEEYDLMWLIWEAYKKGLNSGRNIQRVKDFTLLGRERDRTNLLIDGEISYWVNQNPHEINFIKALKELKEEINMVRISEQ